MVIPKRSAEAEAQRLLIDAREQGFTLFIQTISKTMIGFPIIGVVVTGLVYGAAPAVNVFSWLAALLAFWVISLVVYWRILASGPDISKHSNHVAAVVLLEGLVLGGMAYAFFGHNAQLNAWTMVILIGVTSIVLPTYITYPRAFYILLTMTWLTLTISVILIAEQLEMPIKIIIGTMFYFFGLLYAIQPISRRVQAGLRLQIKNQTLTRQLKESLEKASHQAETDALTGQYNRRALNRILSGLINSSRSRESTFAVLMIDIDHFKSINDELGHDVGDAALQHTARIITSTLREEDICARYGGEEFVILLPSTEIDDAVAIAERIRKTLASTDFEPIGRPTTISIGAAIFEPGMDADAVLKAADQQVYVSKNAGRNQVSACYPDR